MNAMVGKRHFRLRTDFLESLVLALLPPGGECTFESFCEEHLGQQLGLAVDAITASRDPTLSHINRADFRKTRTISQERSGSWVCSESIRTRRESCAGRKVYEPSLRYRRPGSSRNW